MFRFDVVFLRLPFLAGQLLPLVFQLLQALAGGWRSDCRLTSFHFCVTLVLEKHLSGVFLSKLLSVVILLCVATYIIPLMGAFFNAFSPPLSKRFFLGADYIFPSSQPGEDFPNVQDKAQPVPGWRFFLPLCCGFDTPGFYFVLPFYNLLLPCSTTFICKCGMLIIFHLCGIIVDFGSPL